MKNFILKTVLLIIGLIFNIQPMSSQVRTDGVIPCEENKTSIKIDVQKIQTFDLSSVSEGSFVCVYSSKTITSPLNFSFKGVLKASNSAIAFQSSIQNLTVDNLTCSDLVGVSIEINGGVSFENLSFTNTQYSYLNVNKGGTLTVSNLTTLGSSNNTLNLNGGVTTFLKNTSLAKFSYINQYNSELHCKGTLLLGDKEIKNNVSINDGSVFNASILEVSNCNLSFNDSKISISGGDMLFQDNTSKMDISSSRLEVKGNLLKQTNLTINLYSYSYLKLGGLKAVLEDKNSTTFNSSMEFGCAIVEATSSSLNETFARNPNIYYYGFKPLNPGFAPETKDPNACLAPPKFIGQSLPNVNVGQTINIAGLNFPSSPKDIFIYASGLYDAQGKPLRVNVIKVISDKQIQIVVPTFENYLTLELNNTYVYLNANPTLVNSLGAYQSLKPFWLYGQNLMGANEVWVRYYNGEGYSYTPIDQIVDNTHQDSIQVLSSTAISCNSEIAVARSSSGEFYIEYINTTWVGGFGSKNIIATNKNTLEEILNGVCSYSTITFEGGEYLFNSVLLNQSKKNLTLVGKAGATVIFKDENKLDLNKSGFILENAGTISFKNIQFKDSKNDNLNQIAGKTAQAMARTLAFVPAGIGGAILVTNGTDLVLEDMKFENNYAATAGGAIAVYNEGGQSSLPKPSLTIKSNVDFINNTAGVTGGGAIYIYNDANININDAEFTKNFSGIDASGGAIYYNLEQSNMSSTEKSIMYMDKCAFTDNGVMTMSRGGAIALDSKAYSEVEFRISNTQFTNNKASSGGAILNSKFALQLESNNFDGNEANKGGAIDFFNENYGVSKVNSCTFLNNKAVEGSGGAMYAESFVPNVTNSTFYKNTSIKNGGAISYFGPSLYNDILFDKNLFEENSTDGSGGAIYIADEQGFFYYNFIVSNSSLINNNSGADGGAIYSFVGANINHSSFIGNKSKADAGALYLDGNGTVDLSHLTIARNTAETGKTGGVFFNSYSNNVSNCAIGENKLTGNITSPQYFKNTSSQVYFTGKNIITTATEVTAQGFLGLTHLNQLYLEPQLTVLGNQKYLKPFSFSPLVDQINTTNGQTVPSTPIDQIGNGIYGKLLDVGAIEYVDGINPLNVTLTEDALKNGSIRGTEVYVNYHYGNNDITFGNTLAGVELRDALVFISNLLPVDSTKKLSITGSTTTKNLIGRSNEVTQGFNFIEINHTTSIQNLILNGVLGTTKNDGTGIVIRNDAAKSVVKNLIIKNNRSGISSRADSVQILNCTIYSNSESGILLSENSTVVGEVIQGNIIGLDENYKTPSAAQGQNHSIVGIAAMHSKALIGGTLVSERNIIAGNNNIGLAIGASNIRVLNNLIGITPSNTKAPNKIGIDFVATNNNSTIQNNVIGALGAFNTIGANQIGINLPSSFSDASTPIYASNKWSFNTFVSNDTLVKLESNPNYQNKIPVPQLSYDVDSVIHGRGQAFASVFVYLDDSKNASYYVDSVVVDKFGVFSMDLKTKSNLPKLRNYIVLQELNKNTSAFSESRPLGCLDTYQDSLGLKDSTYTFCNLSGVTPSGELKLTYKGLKKIQWYIESDGFITNKNDTLSNLIVTNSTRVFAKVELNNGCILNSDTVAVNFAINPVVKFNNSTFCLSKGELLSQNVTVNDSVRLKYTLNGKTFLDTLTSQSSGWTLKDSISKDQLLIIESAQGKYCPAILNYDTLYLNTTPDLIPSPLLNEYSEAYSCKDVMNIKDYYSSKNADTLQFYWDDEINYTLLTDSLIDLNKIEIPYFKVTAIGSNSCSANENFNVYLSYFYTEFFQDSLSICNEDTIYMNQYFSSEDSDFKWQSSVFTFDDSTLRSPKITGGFGVDNVTVTVKNENGCELTDTLFLRRTVPFTLKDTTLYDCGKGVVLSESLSNNRPDLVYNIMQTSLKLGDTIKYDGVVVNYGLYVEDTLTTCSSYSNFYLNDGAISVTSTFINPICFGYEDGKIDLLVKNQGGEIPLVNWISANVGGQKGTSISNLGAGKYEVEARANGCADTSSIVLTSPPALAYTKTQNVVQFCSGTTSTFNLISAANSTYNFNWTAVPIGLSISNITTMNPEFSSIVPGTFKAYVNIKDQNGCIAKDSIQVVVNQLPLVDAGKDINICIGDTATLSQSGALTYSWGQTQLLPNLRIAPKVTSTYILTGVDNFGCSNTDDVKVIVNALPKVSAIASKIEVCIGDSVRLNGSGAKDYVWNNGILNNKKFIVNETKEYIVKGIDTNLCAAKDTIMISVKSLQLGESITVNDTFELEEDLVTKFQINKGFINVNQLDLTYKLTDNISNGNASISADSVTFNFTANFNGLDTMKYRVTDPLCKVDSGFVFVKVNAVNDAHVKNSPITILELTGTSQTSKPLNVLLNYFDVDGDLLAVNENSIKSTLSGSTIVYDNVKSTFTYTSPAILPLDEISMDTLTFKVCDNQTTNSICVDDTIIVRINVSSKLLVDFSAIPKAICLGDEISINALVQNKLANLDYEWSYFNYQDDNIDTDSNLTTTPSEAGDFLIKLVVREAQLPPFDTSFVVKVNDPSLLKTFNLELTSKVGEDTTVTSFTHGMELFSCSKINYKLIDSDKIIIWKNDNLSSFGTYPFTISDLDKVCSIRDSLVVKINDKDTTTILGLTVDYGLKTITQKPIVLPNFGNITGDSIIKQSEYGTSTIIRQNNKIELKFISDSTKILNDAVTVRFYDVCKDSVTVRLPLVLQNSRPTPINTNNPVTFKIDGKKDLILSIDSLAIDRNKNQRYIKMIGEYPGLIFDTEYATDTIYGIIAAGLSLKVNKKTLSKDILLGIKDTINVYYVVCDPFECSDTLHMILRFEFDTPPSVIDLSPFTKKQIKANLDVIIVNNAVSKNKGLAFDYLWKGDAIPDLENISFELTIMSRWGDVVYHESGSGKSIEWFGDYLPVTGNMSDSKVEDGNYFFVLTVQYKDSKGVIGDQHKSGHLYYINRNID